MLGGNMSVVVTRDDTEAEGSQVLSCSGLQHEILLSQQKT